MKILTIHADFIEFEAKKKALKDASPAEEGKKRVEECLVVFTAVEKRDEEDLHKIIDKYVQEIKNVAVQVNAKNIVLYPYAHLSSSLSAPKKAEHVLIEAEKLLTENKYHVTRAPFGWYKSFDLKCKGHPLSELSREFSVGEKEHLNLKKEAKDEPFIFDPKTLTSKEKAAYSATAVIAKAVQELFPKAQIGSSGFYHEQVYVDIAGAQLKNEDLPRVEKQVHKILQRNLTFSKSSPADVSGSLQEQIFHDIGPHAQVWKFDTLTLVPLFSSPFVHSIQEITVFKFFNLASVYWKNNSNNEQLTRIYAVAFAQPTELEEYLQKREEAEARSHIKLGKELGLFVISELVGPGLPLLAPKGMILRTEIVQYLWQLHKDKGYQQVWTPHIAKEALYKTSGHWEKFGDELFKVKGKSDDFILKPMNCPHHMQIFANFSYSYRDMPVRFFEPATVYRDEKSGQLHGLSRVRSITQDDGHLFCRMMQIQNEVSTIVKVIHEFYHTLNMDKDYWVSLSIRGADKSKYLGTDEGWKRAEEALESAAKELCLPYQRREGEAAFYGPKLDFLFKDSLGREWQLATIQCDFNLPERFNLSFMNELGEKERPVVVHRAISGSLERFLSILIEHFAGKFPLWLSPVQVKIVTVTDRSQKFAEEILQKLKEQNIRAELDDRTESIGKKIREATLEKVNYIITLGDKEMESKKLSVRSRNGEVKYDLDADHFLASLKEEIEKKLIR